MHAIWKGSISFGLVNIPIALYPATSRDDVKFRLLRKSDLSPVNYKRVAEADGKEVPWEEIVKGYEYEKGRFVVMNEEDFDKVEIESTQTVEIMEFVELSEIDPMFFNKPYYMEPQKGGDKAYALLRDALEESGKVGVAKVVIKTREYLAAIKPKGDALVLELMNFAEELRDVHELRVPQKVQVGKNEMEMAKTLIDRLTGKWNPETYRDEYRDALMKLIEKKIEAGGKELPVEKPGRRAPTKVVDLAEVLKQSLAQSKARGREPAKRKKAA